MNCMKWLRQLHDGGSVTLSNRNLATYLPAVLSNWATFSLFTRILVNAEHWKRVLTLISPILSLASYSRSSIAVKILSTLIRSHLRYLKLTLIARFLIANKNIVLLTLWAYRKIKSLSWIKDNAFILSTEHIWAQHQSVSLPTKLSLTQVSASPLSWHTTFTIELVLPIAWK